MQIRRVTQADLKLGMLLPWNVYSDKGMLLVRKGHMIASAKQIDDLVQRGSFDDDSEQGPAKRQPDSVLCQLNLVHLQLQALLPGIAAGSAPDDVRRQLEQLGGWSMMPWP